MFVCNRLETWECEQNEWLETVKVLRHYQNKVASVSGSCHPAGVTPTKKRKVDVDLEAAEGNCGQSVLFVVHVITPVIYYYVAIILEA